ncbi:tuberoinfundibular peptide of 39 residues [Neosynchiropus ocellatus]
MLTRPALRRASLLLLIALCVAGTTPFPQPQLSLSSSDFRNTEHKTNGWSIVFPSVSLRDWSLQMMSQPSLRANSISDFKPGLLREAWVFPPEGADDRYSRHLRDDGVFWGNLTSQTPCSLERTWPPDWSSPYVGMVKRNMVVADDAAFREKSKLLTSLERQKWLNSYMQKLLVVKSQ